MSSIGLDPARPLDDELRRVVDARLSDAHERLSRTDPERLLGDVHAVRRSLKEVRAALRLFRSGMPPAARAHLGPNLRRAAADLATLRDADVALTTYTDLSGPDPDRADLAALTRDLQAARADADEAVAAARTRLAAVRDTAQGCRWQLDTQVLHAGLRRTHRRARHLLGTLATPEARPELAHEWRKQVKDTWYQMRLLAPAWPDLFDTLAEEAHLIAELLGREHDLWVLEDRLGAAGQAAAPSGACGALPADRAARRAALRARACAHGARLYAPSPSAFADVLLNWWQGAVRQAGR